MFSIIPSSISTRIGQGTSSPVYYGQMEQRKRCKNPYYIQEFMGALSYLMAERKLQHIEVQMRR